MPSPARKFMLAGRGGLNITHSEPLDAFAARYRNAADRLRPIIREVPARRAQGLVRGAGRGGLRRQQRPGVPEAFQASPLLRAWLRRLESQGVVLKTGRRWIGFDGPRGLRFATADGEDRDRARRRGPRPRRRELAAPRLDRRMDRHPRGSGRRRRAAGARELRIRAALERRHAGAFSGRRPLKRIALAFGGATARRRTP